MAFNNVGIQKKENKKKNKRKNKDEDEDERGVGEKEK